MVTRSQINRDNMGKILFPGISTSAGREKPQPKLILACNSAFLGQFTQDPRMELMSLLNPTNVLAEMELMSLLMYQEQLMLAPYYQSQLASLLQQQENYILSSLTHRQTMTEPPTPPEEESSTQSEPLDLSLSPPLQQKRSGAETRTKALSQHCGCPLCGKQFSRPWLLKGKPGRDKTCII